MPFFLVKVGEEVAEGDFSGAWKTLTGGVEPEIQTVETDVGNALQSAINVAGPEVVKTLLTSAATAISSGIKTGLTDLETGLITDAKDAGTAAAGAL